MLIPVQLNPSWQLSLAQLSPSLYNLFLQHVHYILILCLGTEDLIFIENVLWIRKPLDEH